MKPARQGHFYCENCATLFAAKVEGKYEQRCPECGELSAGNDPTSCADESTPIPRVQRIERPPSPKRHGVSQDVLKIKEATYSDSSGSEERVERSLRRGKKKNRVWVFTGIWVFVLLGVALAAHYFSGSDKGASAPPPNLDKELTLDQIKQIQRQEDKDFLESGIKPCLQVMRDFLKADSTPLKAQFVYQSVKRVGEMSRYYRHNSGFLMQDGKVDVEQVRLLKFPDQKAIAAIFKTQANKKIEALFIHEDGEWQIDWQFLVRYSDSSLPIFLLGEDGDEGEFRLYMRIKKIGDELASSNKVVVFYQPPVYIDPEFEAVPSMDVNVASESPLGKKVNALRLNEDKLTEDPYGLLLDGVDPPGFHRVRVKLRLKKKEGETPKMELLEILANDWYGAGIVGEELPESR